MWQSWFGPPSATVVVTWGAQDAHGATFWGNHEEVRISVVVAVCHGDVTGTGQQLKNFAGAAKPSCQSAGACDRAVRARHSGQLQRIVGSSRLSGQRHRKAGWHAPGR